MTGDSVARLERFGFPIASGEAGLRGVAYSADPHTGRRDWTRIESNGAGVVVEESLVRSTVARRTGPRRLVDAHALSLARLVRRIEWALGEGQDPQRVTWEFNGQRFSIVDAQPIERLPRNTVPLAERQPELWSDGNLKDAIAGVPTTASWSFIGPYLRSIFYAPIAATGYPIPPGMEVLRRFEGRAYLDLSTLQAIYFKALGSLPAEAGRAIGGPQVAIDLPAATKQDKLRWHRARLRLAWLLVRQARDYPRAIARMHQAMRQLASIDLTSRTNAELSNLAERIGDLQAEFGPIFQMGNLDGGAWFGPLEQTIERARPGQGQRLAAALMAGSGEVISAQHGYAMVELAAIAARDDLDPYQWQALPAAAPFRRALERFLDVFGSRAVYEAELANPRWIEDPTFVLEQVAALMAHGRLDQPDWPARQRRAEAERDVDALPLVQRMVVRWLAGRARHTAAMREAGKAALVAMALPVRQLLLEYGRRLVHQGVMDQVDDVFHLARADLEALVLGEWDGRGTRALVEERRALRNARLAAPPPPDLIVVGAPAQPGTVAVHGSTLKGMGAAAGRARGPARLLRHPTEGGRLQPGDILVAPSTDPGWTPLFLRCAGLVTEIGGYLSHGAIVARELGLPAVVNVPGILEALTDGETIVVDGDNGLITRATRT